MNGWWLQAWLPFPKWLSDLKGEPCSKDTHCFNLMREQRLNRSLTCMLLLNYVIFHFFIFFASRQHYGQLIKPESNNPSRIFHVNLYWSLGVSDYPLYGNPLTQKQPLQFCSWWYPCIQFLSFQAWRLVQLLSLSWCGFCQDFSRTTWIFFHFLPLN